MKGKIRVFLVLHIVLMVYSVSGVLSKSAGQEPFLSKRFILFYGGLILLLGLYAIAWQQIIKHLPIGIAYANKAVLSGWALVWGRLFFHETITPGKLVGMAIVIFGVVLLSTEKGAVDES